MDVNDKPEVRPSRIEGWGRRAGGFTTPKGERFLKLKAGGKASSSNSHTPNQRFHAPGAKPVKRARTVNGILIDREDC